MWAGTWEQKMKTKSENTLKDVKKKTYFVWEIDLHHQILVTIDNFLGHPFKNIWKTCLKNRDDAGTFDASNEIATTSSGVYIL